MRAFLALALLATPLAACGFTPPASPGSIAQTGIDDATLRFGIAATDGYTAASKAGLLLVQLGVLDKAKYKALDNRGFAFVDAMHSAYVARNSADYFAAASQLNQVVKDFSTAFGK